MKQVFSIGPNGQFVQDFPVVVSQVMHLTFSELFQSIAIASFARKVAALQEDQGRTFSEQARCTPRGKGEYQSFPWIHVLIMHVMSENG